MNIGVHVFFWITAFVSSGYILEGGISGSCGDSNFLRNFHIVLHSGCTSLHSHQQRRKVPFLPYPLQHILFVYSLIVAILTHVRWYLTVVLVCISLMINSVEHLFVCLMVTCISVLGKWLFSSVNWVVYFLDVVWAFSWCCMSCLYRMLYKQLEVDPLSDTLSANLFFDSMDCLFVL